MKSSGISNGKIIAGIAGMHIIMALVFYFLLLPLVIPAGVEDSASLRLNFTVAGVVFALLTCFVCVFTVLSLRGGDGKLVEFLDAVRIPFIVLDANGRYLMVNKEAERVLGVGRQPDLGSPLATDVQKALVGSNEPSGDPDPRAVIQRGDAHYHVMDHAMPGRDGSRERVVVLRDITGRARMKQSLTELNAIIQALTDNTMKISDTSVTVSHGATKQASSISAISSSLDEFSKRIQGNTESAEKGTKLADQAREAAERSGNEIANALTAMTDVQEAGVRIARIVKLIDDIAFQTNLLALNAAVEAARAGRQGKGFAVVADEVRNLAGRSAKAAKDTALMVEDVTVRIGNASTFITKLEEMLRNIVHDAVRMADSSASATATSTEQATAILQVNQELGQMNSITQSTQSAAEATASAVEMLTNQVTSLKQRLDDMNREFNRHRDRDERPAPYERRRPIAMPDERDLPSSIDLTSEPPPLGTDSFFTGFATQSLSSGNSEPPPLGSEDVDMEEFEAPFKKMTDRDWKKPSSDFSRQGERKNDDPFAGFESKYGKASRTGTDHLSGEAPGEFRTSDGDRIVKPSQHIKLDDSEFGRY